MSNSRTQTAAQRRLQFEQFEQRLVMSAQAVAAPIVELLPEMAIAAPALTGQDVVWQQSESGDQATVAADIAAQYDLDGSGQTIAVIDSGIAWDHEAFGGAFGEGNHVVGGWDFAENDANPYDDGPAGYHGSHVAGIIGSLDDQYKGVAAGADLVSLRVFDDNGTGQLEWVEEALRWVHENQNQFENPITTVNLSLGTGWNPETTPGWGQLDDEFAALKEDGIFVSVAAGNYFNQINDVGLSYPAASEHVVPVASHDADGNLSDFSQRDSGVLVAPGEMLRSPVPDHLFGGTLDNQFLASSGTSMAAPYVAGVSSILREANWFMGETDVTQETIYQQFLRTADQAYDSTTQQSYHNINLRAALDHVIADHHAESLIDATNLGQVGSDQWISGTIGRLDDVDAIKFTATETGRVTLTVEATHDLAPEIETLGSNLRIDGNEISFDVVAGQEFGFKVSTTAGTGHYDIAVGYELQASVPNVDLGVVIAKEFSGLTVNQDSSYRVTPLRSGWMTIEALPPNAAPMTVEVYDANQNLVGSTSVRQSVADSDAGLLRIDVDVIAGNDYFFKLVSAEGENHVDVRVTNLVSVSGNEITIHGTNAADQFTFDHSSESDFSFSINGLSYTVDDASTDSVRVIGHGGSDSISVVLGDRADKVATRSDGVYIGNQSLTLTAHGTQTQVIDGGGGYDTVFLNDTVGSEQFFVGTQQSWGHGYWASLTGSSFSSRVTGFEVVHAESHGEDTARFNGTNGNETFVSRGSRNILRMDGANLLVDGFDQVFASGGGGDDLANLFDSEGNDQFVLSPNAGSISNQNYFVRADGFGQVNAFSESGIDSVALSDSTDPAARDLFAYRDGFATLYGDGYGLYAKGFANVAWQSSGGDDLAQVFDTVANDQFRATAQQAELIADGVTVTLTDVSNVGFISNRGGYDRVTLEGTVGDDQVTMNEDQLRVTHANGDILRIYDAEEAKLDLLAGVDQANLQGSSGRDQLEISDEQLEFESTLRLLQMTNYDQVHFDGGDGKDSVEVSGTMDLLSSLGDRTEIDMMHQKLVVENISFLEAHNVDSAIAEYDLDSPGYTYMLRGNWQDR
ncbi:MAG: S8 family serine peptidase [Planctomycetota bacterium]